MKRFVIDASVLVKLFFEEEHSDASAVFVKQASELLAPDLIWVEAGSVVWKRLRRGEISSEDAAGLFEAMLRVPISISPGFDLASPALALASQTGSTVYDCLYLALALREDLTLLTGDRRLCSNLIGSPVAKHVRFVGDKA